MEVKQAELADWPEIRRIYVEGIRTKNATFELEEDVTQDGAAWFAGKVPNSVFKAVDKNGRVLGWTALSPVSSRCVYQGVAELSVYVSESARGQGVGNTLMQNLIDTSEKDGIWTLQTSIFPENKASISLHEKYGFRILGIRQKIGKHFGKWRDTAFLERRSQKIM